MRSLLIAMALLAGCTDPACDAASLRAMLASAGPGAVVDVGACEVEGPFDVPEGVTLRGERVDLSAIAGPVTLADGAALEDLTVLLELGHGVEARDVSAVALRGVTLVGPVTEDNADAFGADPTPAQTATHGVVLVNVSGAILEDVTAIGFARFGALFVDSGVEWRGGGALANRATGIMASGGTIHLADVRIADTIPTSSPIPSYGAVFLACAVTTERLELATNEYGAIHDGVTAAHTDLRAEDNAQPALWAQRSASFTLDGAASFIARNGLAGIIAVDVDALTIAGVEVRETRVVTRVVGTRGVEIGDGIQVDLPTTTGLRIDGVRLIDNGRAGLVIETTDGVVQDAALGAITVSASGAGLGAIAQSETAVIPTDAWGASIVREGAAIANDPALASPIDVVSAVAPMFFPAE